MSKKNKHVEFFDETLRDGVQSLWAMRMRYGMFDAVAEEMDQAGFSAIQFAFMFQQIVRLGENPWEILRLINRKIKKTKLSTIVCLVKLVWKNHLILQQYGSFLLRK